MHMNAGSATDFCLLREVCFQFGKTNNTRKPLSSLFFSL